MGLINNISNRILGKEKNAQADKIIKQATLRRCHFETMEERKVLSADPVVAGVTYLEGDEGGDGTPDHFEVTYEGGSDTTELTQFVISGDQDLSGTISSGDIFFDATATEPGTAEFHGFLFDASTSSGISQSDIVSAVVSDDGLTLTVEVDNFVAGDVLGFTIDVDEVEGRRNDRIASGVEFEGSLFTATFADEHFTFESLDASIETTLIDGFEQEQFGGQFFDEYDELIAEGENLSGGLLDLTRDNELGLEDRTAGAIDAYELVERPIAISGTVFHDEDIDCIHDGTEEGIAGVNIDLQRLNEQTGQYETVASTVTDQNGDYEFGVDLGLTPGTYQVVQIQPEGFLDTGAVAGSEGGTILEDANGNANIISAIEIPLGNTFSTNNDFKEVLPASLSGYVSINDPGQAKLSPDDPNFRPIEGVTIQLFDENGDLVRETQTDANGRYEFDGLPPGTYSIAQVQPSDLIDGADVLGTVDGETVGSTTNDLFTEIVLGSGDVGENFNFCEVEPASIKGTVYHDRNNNGIQDPGEEGIEGVVIQLFDADGNVVAETTTDANGDYCFEDLAPGEYKIREQQPENFDDGIDTVGNVDGVTNGEHGNDEFCVIILNGGDQGVEYNFGELRLAEITGFVHVDNDGDRIFGSSPSDRPIADVTLELLDTEGNVLATTTTNSDGSYSFTGLLPGTYAVRQIQPDGFFSGGERVGDGGGEASENLIENIMIESGQTLTQHNFCEHEAAEIHGRVFEDGPAFETQDGNLPTNFRDQRDGVFQEGVDTPIEGVRLELYFFIDPTGGDEGQIDPRPVTISEVDADEYPHIDASDPNAPVFVETNADGEYWFSGLRAGNYIVLEVQPDGFEDANDVVGTTTGTTFNSDADIEVAFAPLTRAFSDVQLQDVVAGIQVENGGISQLNNFTEVSVTVLPPEPPEPPQTINPPTPADPIPLSNPITPRPGITGIGGLLGSEPSAFTQFIGTARGGSFQSQQDATPEDPYTWHLSIINGGQPRAFGGDGAADSIWHQAGHIDSTDWNRYDMTEAVWTYTSLDEDGNISINSEKSSFGMLGGTPLAGDFDGDGIDEIAVFKDGYWLIDINNNGRWDQEDLFAKLGDVEDRPVVGDWDGDGKDDIGIFGPMWERDQEAIDQEPGLPNPDNDLVTRPKNVPPTDAAGANGARVMKLSSYGQNRSDVVDHVFGIEEGTIMPVTGDWNGNGIRSIGKFVDGHWEIDVNGDGRFDHQDETFDFGRAGDTPLVGDFNGDGIEEIAVYRSGKWLIDTDGNRELTATDKTFELGGAADRPVVGDFNGDGIDEPGLITETPATDIQL